MYDWLTDAMRGAPFETRRSLMRHRDAIDRLRVLELRDRWGYHLEPHKLADIAAYVEANVDRAALAQRSRARAVVVEMVDLLAVGMAVHEVPQFCSGYDTPAEDALIETVVRTTLNLKEPSMNFDDEPRNAEGF